MEGSLTPYFLCRLHWHNFQDECLCFMKFDLSLKYRRYDYLPDLKFLKTLFCCHIALLILELIQSYQIIHHLPMIDILLGGEVFL